MVLNILSAPTTLAQHMSGFQKSCTGTDFAIDKECDARLRPFFMSGIETANARQAINRLFRPEAAPYQATVVSLLLEMVRSKDHHARLLGYQYVAACFEHPDLKGNEALQNRICQLFFARAREYLVSVLGCDNALYAIARLSDLDLIMLRNGPREGLDLLRAVQDKARQQYRKPDKPKDDKSAPRPAPRRQLTETEESLERKLVSSMQSRRIPTAAVEGRWTLKDLAKFSRLKALELSRKIPSTAYLVSDVLKQHRGPIGCEPYDEKQARTRQKQRAGLMKLFSAHTLGKAEKKLLDKFGPGADPDANATLLYRLVAMLNSGSKLDEKLACEALLHIFSRSKPGVREHAVAMLYGVISDRLMTERTDRNGNCERFSAGQRLGTLSDFELCLLSSAMPTGIALDRDPHILGMRFGAQLPDIMDKRPLSANPELRTRCLTGTLTLDDLCTLLTEMKDKAESATGASPFYPRPDMEPSTGSSYLHDCMPRLERMTGKDEKFAEARRFYEELAIVKPLKSRCASKARVLEKQLEGTIAGFHSLPDVKARALIRTLTVAIMSKDGATSARGYRVLARLLGEERASRRALTLLVEDSFEFVAKVRRGQLLDRFGDRDWNRQISDVALDQRIAERLCDLHLLVVYGYQRGHRQETVVEKEAQQRFAGTPEIIDGNLGVRDIVQFCQSRAGPEPESSENSFDLSEDDEDSYIKDKDFIDLINFSDDD